VLSDSTGTCAGVACTQDECCNAPQVCSASSFTNDSTCVSAGAQCNYKYFDASATCAGAACLETECCARSKCSVSSFSSDSTCVSAGSDPALVVFEENICSGALCTEAECCHAVDTCAVSFTNDAACATAAAAVGGDATLVMFDAGGTCAGITCTQSECCQVSSGSAPTQLCTAASSSSCTAPSTAKAADSRCAATTCAASDFEDGAACCNATRTIELDVAFEYTADRRRGRNLATCESIGEVDLGTWKTSIRDALIADNEVTAFVWGTCADNGDGKCECPADVTVKQLESDTAYTVTTAELRFEAIMTAASVTNVNIASVVITAVTNPSNPSPSPGGDDTISPACTTAPAFLLACMVALASAMFA